MTKNNIQALEQEWKYVSSVARSQYGETIYTNLFKNLKVISCDNGNLILSSNQVSTANIFNQNYVGSILDIWKGQNSSINSIVVKANNVIDTVGIPDNTVEDTAIKPSFAQETKLNKNYSFQKFIVSNSNEMAYDTALHILNDDRLYSQLFIYGGTSSGKTHLLQAIGNKIIENKPNTNLIYLTAEEFSQKYIDAIKAQTMHDFKEYIRSADYFILDDIQFLENKTSTQEEFSNSLNHLLQNGGCVIISSNKYPSEMPSFNERLKSRISGGMISQIKAADKDLKIATLIKKCRLINIELDINTAKYIIKNINPSIREIESIALRLYTAYKQDNIININSVNDILKDFIKFSTKPIQVEEIQQEVCEYYNIRMIDLLSKRRTRDIARPRQIAMYVSKMMTTNSLPYIGSKFSNRDHTTVLHAIKKVEELMTNDKSIKNDVEQILNKFRGE